MTEYKGIYCEVYLAYLLYKLARRCHEESNGAITLLQGRLVLDVSHHREDKSLTKG